MSADNVIYIKNIKKLFYVWHDFMSHDPTYKNNKTLKKYKTRNGAINYAKKLNVEWTTEYGIVFLN